MTKNDAAKPIANESATPRLRRRLLGYRRKDVDAWVFDSRGQLIELREELMERTEAVTELEGNVHELKLQLRYWEDRAAFIDSQLSRVHEDARRIEHEARERADQVEKTAQGRALQMVDRVCVEANTILQHARDEAREIYGRNQQDINRSRVRVEQMSALQVEVSNALHRAMERFQEGVFELDKVQPTRQHSLVARVSAAAAQQAPPRERTLPTFGRTRALEAAQLLDDLETPDGGDPHDAALATLKVLEGDSHTNL